MPTHSSFFGRNSSQAFIRQVFSFFPCLSLSGLWCAYRCLRSRFFVLLFRTQNAALHRMEHLRCELLKPFHAQHICYLEPWTRPRSYFSTPDTFMKRERLWRVGFSCDAYRLEMSRKSSLWYFCANTVGALISSDPQKSFQRTVKAWKPARQDLNAVPSSPTRDGIFTRLGLKRTRTQSALFSSYQLPEYIHCFTALKSPQGIVMSLRYGFKFSYYCFYFAHCLLSG